MTDARTEALKEAYDFAGGLAFKHESAGRHMQAATAAVIANEINNMIHGVGKYKPETEPHSLRAPTAATVPAREPASPRVVPSSLRAGWQWLRDASGRLEGGLLGDVLGVAAIVLIFLIFLFATV